MLKRFTRETHRILLSGIPCMDVRGFTEPELIEARRRSTMDKLAQATAEGDKVLVF